jgi:RNase P protein component
MSDHAVISRPSLIAPEGETKSYEGAGLYEAARGIVDGIQSGNWLGVAGNGVAAGLSFIGAVMDPLQAVFAAGVGWLMEHVSILREPLDKLAGDPKAIEGHAQTWYNIERRIYEATDFFVDQVNRSTAEWTSQAAEAYRRLARTHAESVQALGAIADAMSKATTIVGAMVGVVRNTIRDIVAEVVGACISKALQAVTVVLIPKVAAEVAILVGKTSSKILNLLRQLFEAIKRIGVLVKQCDSILAQIGQASRNTLRLEAFRIQAVLEHGGSGLNGFRGAFNTIGQGHTAVHGPIGQVVVNTGRQASQTNGSQNAGQTGDTLRGDNPAPTPIKLPL